MASASVNGAAGLEPANCFDSVGRRWANSPITAHPKRRMHAIPLRVVQLSPQGSYVRTLKPWQAEVAQFKCDREWSNQLRPQAVDSAGKKKVENTPVMHPSPQKRSSGLTGTHRPAR